MPATLKKISEQVIVITGATSEIGLATARQAAQRGARLVLAARTEPALTQLAAELSQRGTNVITVIADVGDEAQVRAIAQAAIAQFGGFDTWISNAGASPYGHTETIPLADQKRLFETSFWGVVHGSVVAVEHLRQSGGAVINIAGDVSVDVEVPLRGISSAAKDAVKAHTDALRIELENSGAPVSVTLVKAADLDSPSLQQAVHYRDTQPRPPPSPAYAPDLAASAILFAAQRPRRDVYVGGAARLASASSRLAPRTTDWLLKKTKLWMQRRQPAARKDTNDPQHAARLRDRDRGSGRLQNLTPYTRAVIHPRISGALMVGLLVALGYWWVNRSRDALR